MLGGRKGFWRSKRRGILIASSVIVLLTAFLLFYEPSSPDGTYYWPELACGHGVCIFKDGKIYTQCPDEKVPEEVGAYIKSGNKWLSFPQNGNGQNGIFIKPTVLGIKMYGLSSNKSFNFYFRDQFSWVIYCEELLVDSKNWIGSNFFP
jgi:hypothetical protein